ncbi:MAG: hypothetical protein H8D34_15680 [Chloroflexi bacterium]|nr:hypothetical protein [Chloroflexota bacterium]MBL6961300.1 hypothetical protein [Anaerolineales bacterium]
MDKMIGKMAKMFPMMIALGFMIVLAAFVVGYNNSQTAAAYFAQPKALRETTMMAQRASMESVGLWMPPFKFLGLGFILAGIVMALRIIIDNLKGAGEEVLSNLPANARPQLPEAPWYGRIMPMAMMLGEMFFFIAFGVGVWLSGIARTVFANPLPAIDAARPGSALLTGIQTIHIVEGWLVPFKFFAISTEFLAITMGLATIIFILSAQTKMLSGVLVSGK